MRELPLPTGRPQAHKTAKKIQEFPLPTRRPAKTKPPKKCESFPFPQGGRKHTKPPKKCESFPFPQGGRKHRFIPDARAEWRRRWQKIYRNRFGCETLVFAIAFDVSRQRAHADRADRAREQPFLSCCAETDKSCAHRVSSKAPPICIYSPIRAPARPRGAGGGANRGIYAYRGSIA